jgi:hypothetical protein
VIVINLGKATGSYFRKIRHRAPKLKIFVRLAKDFTFIYLSKKYASLE